MVIVKPKPAAKHSPRRIPNGNWEDSYENEASKRMPYTSPKRASTVPTKPQNAKRSTGVVIIETKPSM